MKNTNPTDKPGMKKATMIIFAGQNSFMTYKELEFRVIDAISGLYGQNEARSVQRFLFSCFSGFDPAGYLLIRNNEADEDFENIVKLAIPRLIEFEPVQYITGKTWFCGFEFSVRPGVLVPRPETENLVMKIAERYRTRDNISILDIGTGSGAIAISLYLLIGTTRVEAIDISDVALGIAKENAVVNRADVGFSMIDILDPNACESLPSYSLIVSNPPYIRQSEKSLMRKNVLDFEPETALFVEDSDPLIYYRAIAGFALSHLEPGGELWFEINESEGNNLKVLLNNMGFRYIEIIPDLNSRPRYAFVQLK
jgi:release factor glutamine methyltransferase